jgi:hypothetical protein
MWLAAMGEKKRNVKRLAKSLRANQKRARTGRARKDPLRAEPGSDARRTLGHERELPPLTRLMGALQKEKIRFQVIGMSAAIVQGVPGGTNDVDLWIDLSPREYMRAINVAVANGAEMIRNTVVALPDQTLVNFVYEVTGLGSFKSEFSKSKKMTFRGVPVHVLPLESIRKSKLAIQRPKDLVHVQQIDDCLRCKKADRKGKLAARHGFEP